MSKFEQQIVDICNSALLRLGAERISSINEPSKEANLCKEQYQRSHRDLLRSHPWNFAVRRKQLGRLEESPAFEFSHAYQLPNDCIRVLAIDRENIKDENEFQIEGDKILTDLSSLKIKYISNVQDPRKFDFNYKELLALKLAKDIAYSVTQSSNLVQLITNDFERAYMDARSFNAQEGTPQEISAEDWLNARI